MSISTHYDTIVIGAGGVGSAALYHLAIRGARVLGLDRFQPPHTHGSSHGQTRIIRQAYFEHPDYTPLVLEAYQLWQELENRTGQQLYQQTGVLQIGPPDGEVVGGVLLGAAQHNLRVEQFSAEAIERRWPVFRVPAGMVGVLEPQAGFLRVEQCVQAHLDAAIAAGAELKSDAEVLGWQAGPPVLVDTAEAQYSADRLVITAGAWAGSLLSELGIQLQVLRKSLFWHPVETGQEARYEELPCFLFELPEGVFYGFPPTDGKLVKIAEHSGGQPIEDSLNVSRDVDPTDQQRTHQFITGQLPGLSAIHTDHDVCLYTMSPDQHFIVDRHPEHPHVAFAAGLSGHGFKFTSVLGKALAELVMDGETQLPIGFLELRDF